MAAEASTKIFKIMKKPTKQRQKCGEAEINGTSNEKPTKIVREELTQFSEKNLTIVSRAMKAVV